DEIQCGMARCGRMFAHQIYGIDPDIMTVAKALGNGYPIGATLSTDKVAQVLQPGTHGSTFGGNPMGCAVALAVLDEMARLDIPAAAERTGKYFTDKLKAVLGELPVVQAIRGLGLMIGVVLTVPGADIVKQCAEKGILLNCTMGNVIRILPPLICTEAEGDQVVETLYGLLKEAESEVAS